MGVAQLLCLIIYWYVVWKGARIVPITNNRTELKRRERVKQEIVSQIVGPKVCDIIRMSLLAFINLCQMLENDSSLGQSMLV